MQSIYQDQLLALARRVRDNSSLVLSAPTHVAEVNNPVCGDRVLSTIKLENNMIIAAHAEAKGCALCEAGAGLWLDIVVGQNISSLLSYHAALTSWLAGKDDKEISVKLPTNGLDSFSPVRPIKNRHKCVTLAFSTADKFKRV
ncbi:MAG: iron-sulfur cluster assembly scaffold protein [Candidatus Puniceispirillaceae bacterium]